MCVSLAMPLSLSEDVGTPSRHTKVLESFAYRDLYECMQGIAVLLAVIGLDTFHDQPVCWKWNFSSWESKMGGCEE